MVQLLSNRVELGWNLKATQKISTTLVSRTRKIPYLPLVRALGFSGDDEKSLISLVTANWFATLLKKKSTKPMDSLTDTKPKEIFTNARPEVPKTAESSRSLLVARASLTRHVMTWQQLVVTKSIKLNIKTRLLSTTTLQPLVDPEKLEKSW